MNFEL